MPIFSLKHGGSEARLISYVGWQVFGLLTGSIGSLCKSIHSDPYA